MPSYSAAIDAWGTVRLALPEIPPLRKRLPAWVPESIAGHFLKYTDEQTVAAVAAVDRAIQSYEIDLSQRREWPIIAAPRFLGRVAGPNVIRGYERGGPQSVSPHIIPQNSLHSISGAEHPARQPRSERRRGRRSRIVRRRNARCVLAPRFKPGGRLLAGRHGLGP